MPKVNSIMVFDKWPGNPFGHVAYVIAVNCNEVTVDHSNFDCNYRSDKEVFVLESNNKEAYRKRNGKNSRPYPILGFIVVSDLPNPSPPPQPHPQPQQRYDSIFERDVTIPDGTTIRGGEKFDKKWALKNTGNTTWQKGIVILKPTDSTGSSLLLQQVSVPQDVQPGQSVTISAPMRAPSANGRYTGHYQLASNNGSFGQKFYVDITVTSSKQPSPPPQPHPQPPKDKYYIRIGNIDDLGECFINGNKVASINYHGDTGWIDITQHMRKGKNEITFKVTERGGGWTYYFGFRKGQKTDWEKSCGQVGKKSCNKPKLKPGKTFTKTLKIDA